MANKKPKIVSFSMIRRGPVLSRAANTAAMNKNDLLRLVSDWWDCHGTGFNDYDTLRIRIVEYGKELKNGN